MVIVGCQWLIFLISGYCWLSVVIVGYSWLSVVVVGYEWLLLEPQGPLMSVGFYRINKGGLRTLYSLLVRLTRNSHPFLFFSLEGRSFL